MKIYIENYFLKRGKFPNSPEYIVIMEELREAIRRVTWFSPDIFVINPIKKGNGVVPIKKDFINYLESKKWIKEQRISLVKGTNPGPIDVIKETSFGKFAVEWETGNISSSHRALNKIAVGILQGELIGGILILPSKNLAQYLTDRIGNYEEIYPYLTMYETLRIKEGFMGIIAVDADEYNIQADLIPKGKDGNAK